MTTNQKAWYITFLILLLSLLVAAVIYHFTGHLFLAVVIAPPAIHYFLKKRAENKER